MVLRHLIGCLRCDDSWRNRRRSIDMVLLLKKTNVSRFSFHFVSLFFILQDEENNPMYKIAQAWRSTLKVEDDFPTNEHRTYQNQWTLISQMTRLTTVVTRWNHIGTWTRSKQRSTSSGVDAFSVIYRNFNLESSTNFLIRSASLTSSVSSTFELDSVDVSVGRTTGRRYLNGSNASLPDLWVDASLVDDLARRIHGFLVGRGG